MLEEVDAACAPADEWEAKVRAAIHTVLALLAGDPPTARLLTVEAMAIGPEGARRNDAAIEAFASRLQAGREPDGELPLANAEWTLVAGIAALIGKRVIAGDDATLPALEDELVAVATGLTQSSAFVRPLLPPGSPNSL